MKLFLSSLLVVITQFCMSGATWTDQGNYDTSWYNDLSTTFDIYTPEQFAGFIFLSNNNTSFEGKTINIRADLNMGKYVFPMCEVFAGTLNGNGCAVSNITIKGTGGSDFASIFQKISETGQIQDIQIIDTSINAGKEYNLYAGGIAGENHGIISDCLYKGTIIAESNKEDNNYYYVGGIVAYNFGYVKNCTHIGEVRGCSRNVSLYGYSYIYVGGIVGFNEGMIVNCNNYGSVYAQASYERHSAMAGGICGYSNSVVNNVINFANVTAAKSVTVSPNIKNYYADGICADGECSNAYYSSSCTISAATIPKNGTMLSLEQIRNHTLDFTTMLNNNISSGDFSPVTYWANSPDYNDNEPFLLNILNIDLQCVRTTQKSIIVECRPLQLTSSWMIEKGFEYQKNGSDIINTIVINDSFSKEITDLETDELYNIRAFIKGKTGTVYSKYISVQTSPLNIQTLEATDITPISAILKGQLNVGNTPIKSQGFLWKELDGEYHIIKTEGTSFSAKIDNLKPSTTYMYQAFAIDTNDNSIYGNEISFKTSPVTITIANNETDINSIIVEGYINLGIATDIIVEYCQSGEDVYSRKKVKSDSNGKFHVRLDDLKADTEYEVRAHFIYENTIVYSTVETLRTSSIEVITVVPFVDEYIEFHGEIKGKSHEGEFGFEYRELDVPDMIPSKIVTASLTDNTFSAITTDVINETGYKVRAYYKSISNKYSYGQWIEFRPINVASMNNITIDDKATIIAIYNTGGQRIPFFIKGINIVV